jgi:hypothetical protein
MLTIALILSAATTLTVIAPAVALKLMLNRYWNEPAAAGGAVDEAPRSFVRASLSPSAQLIG